jgi:hypothetical protein
VAFVTSRWAVEATAFARGQGGRPVWRAEAQQCREHLLALVRWLPDRFEPRDGSGDGTDVSGWAALRGRTSLAAPWSLALVVAGAAAAVTGRYLAGPAAPVDAALVAVTGALAAVGVAGVPRRRAAAVLGGAAVLLLVLLVRRVPEPVVALLPWAAVAGAYAYFTGHSLRTMGRLGAQVRRRVLAPLLGLPAAALRVVLGRDTWDAVAVRGGARG